MDDKSLDAELLNNSDKQNLNSQDILKNPKQLDNPIEPGYDKKDIDKINNLIDKIDKK